jgi:hypothetical protein
LPQSSAIFLVIFRDDCLFSSKSSKISHHLFKILPFLPRFPVHPANSNDHLTSPSVIDFHTKIWSGSRSWGPMRVGVMLCISSLHQRKPSTYERRQAYNQEAR